MPRPIPVAFAIDNMHAGGTELNAVRLAERIDRARFALRVVCLRPDGPLAARYDAAGIPVEAFPISSLYGPSALRQGLRLARHLRRAQVAVVHAHDIYSNAFAVFWGRLAGARTIASRRWWEGFPGTAWRTVSRASYAAADAVLANSAGIARMLEEREGIASRKITVVPNFLDDDAFEPPAPDVAASLREELRLSGTGPVVGIVANLLPVKDHATLLRAAAIARRTWPDLRVVLVGDGPCRGELEQLTRALALDGAVVFAGRRPNLPNLHHLFDVSVLCSTSEGFPNSVLEAMAAGRPVAATRVGAVADAVIEGETGVLVPPADPDRLAAALHRLLSDPVQAARLGREGARQARERYSAAAAVKALEDLYDRLAGASETVTRDSRPTAPAARRRSATAAPEDTARRPAASRAS